MATSNRTHQLTRLAHHTMSNTTYTFQQLNNALTNCTSFFLRKGKDEDGDTTYHLLDGCGDQDGDPFTDLYDVQAYITNDQDVFNYLARYNK